MDHQLSCQLISCNEQFLHAITFLWHFNGNLYEEHGRSDTGCQTSCFHCCRRLVSESFKRAEKKGMWSPLLTYQHLSWLACVLPLRQITQKGWIPPVGVWLICCSLTPPPFYHWLLHPPALYSPFYIKMVFSEKKKKVVISLYSTSHTTLVYSGEWGGVMKASLLRENWLSTGTSFPSAGW